MQVIGQTINYNTAQKWARENKGLIVKVERIYGLWIVLKRM
jgi:hypothetical protein